jgi:crossover junction endodeoxyribonuclease RusA
VVEPGGGDGVGVYRLAVPPGMELLNANERLHWAVRAKRTKALREWAGWEARRQRLPHCETIGVRVTVRPGVRTPTARFDPPNWAGTSKACIDGLVDARVVPDDGAPHVWAVTFGAGERTKLARVTVSLDVYPMF